jgi:hypothetical protein
MGWDDARVAKLIAGLGKVVGMESSAEPFDVLKTVAEALGYTVSDEGMVTDAVGKRTHTHAYIYLVLWYACLLDIHS